MNRHQVLTGAANVFENSVAVGSVGHNHFTTYGSGRNLIILSSNFDRVQIISSSKHNSDAIIRCIDCTLDTGKIAAAYSNKVFIFEPTPSAKKATHNIHYKWIEVGVIELESDVECVSWNNDGQRILIGCSIGTLQIWTYNPNADTKNTNDDKKNEDSPVKFSICDETDILPCNEHKQSEEEQNPNIFIKIWESKIVDSIKFVKFSPDGSFFASYGHNDRLVKIWHESSNYLDSAKLDYDFIYLAHPRAVTCLSWRQISKFMPRGMVSNSLITCCKDNICRIWTETVLPDDGLTQHSHNPSSSASSPMVDPDPSGATNIHSNPATNSFLTNSKSVRHKKKLFHKLQKMRISAHFPHFSTKPVSLNSDKATNIHSAYSSNSNLSFLTSMGSNQLYGSNGDQTKSDKSNMPTSPPLLQSTASTNELLTMPKIVSGTAASHYQQSISRAFHFHLAGLIDPDASCIPLHLLPNLNQPNSKESKNFVVHWMQNKDFHFTYTAELFSKEIYQKLKKIYAQQNNRADSNSWSCEDLTESEQTTTPAAADSATEFTLDSLLSINLDDETKNLLFDNSIDQKLDQMLKDWFDSHDVLFCIHPLDGSVLIWLVDWLDENMPGNIYRQAQVSFHAKIPHSFPIGDSSSLTNSSFLYMEPVMSNLEKPELDNEYFYEAGCANLVSKHSNGTLNLWRIQFQDNSKYQSLVNVSHLHRVCGHRFKVSDITSHPILPFLLTNSINDLNTQPKSFEMGQSEDSEFYAKYQKGIVIWGVEPVGPLCKSGGIFELARIDSSKPNAFENIAWFPCFLPSSTLGTSSASPSTLFASTDASQITIYQAVFDARTLLHECSKTGAKVAKATTNSSISSCVSGDSFIGVSNTTEIANNSFNIVSIQSTARPGCIIELEKLVDSSMSNWTKADLFHIYQENLINDQAKVTLNSNNQFEESYFLVLLEKKRNVLPSKNVRIVEIVHMWKISISSVAQNSDETKNRLTIKSTRVCQQELNLPDDVYVCCAATAAADLASSAMFCRNKVAYLFTTACSDGIVRFWSCQVKAGEEYEFLEWTQGDHTSSQVNLNGVFPLTIACSYTSRFAVACKQRLQKNAPASKKNAKAYFVKVYECESSGGSEWKLEDTICLKNIVLPEIDSGIDFDYIFGNSQPIRPARSTHSFRNILFGSSNLPASTCAPVSASGSQPNTINTINTSCHTSCHLASIPSSNSFAMFTNVDSTDSPLSAKTPEIPSTAAKISIKRQFSTNPNDQQHKSDSQSVQSRSLNCKFKNTSLIKLDWASNENGSHILTIGVGNKILVFSCKTKHLQQNQNDSIGQSSEMNGAIESGGGGDDCDSFLKWTEVRSFELDSADDQQALPTQMKWVREGLLVIGLNTEMQVYSQWSPVTNKHTFIHEETTNDENEKLKNLILMSKNASVLDLNKLNFQLSKDMNSGNCSRKHSHFGDLADKSKRPATRKKIFDEGQALELVEDSGLFMHAKNLCPTLPQYHPKQLVELMNSGKVNHAKAILLHLTRCIIDNEFKIKNNTSINSAEKKLKKRKMSVTNELQLPEEHVFNILQIESIPPLPLFQLYSADDKALKSSRAKTADDHKNDLFAHHYHLSESEAAFSSDDIELLTDEDQRQKQAERQQQKEKIDFKKKLLLEANHEFEERACNLLVEYLQFVQLNGLTSTDQMYLVALADTIVNLNCELKTSQSGHDQFNIQANVVDDCGFKFLLSLRSYNYLVRTLPTCLKTSLTSIGLGSANFAWAFHSECEQDLLNQIVNAEDNFNFTWANLKQYGVGWWLKTPAILKQLVERIAKFCYQQNNDPLDSALFYLAMKKKGVLCALFKTGKDTRMSDFFKNDFNEPKWQTAALKNAFVLLGKQRFEHAAAFFLLANRLKDAIEVCLRNLNDIQLALALARLYFEANFEQQNNLIQQILTNEILNDKCADPFLRSMSFWFVKDYTNALNTLYSIDIGHLHILKSSSAISCLGNSKDSMISHVFNFYNFLKSHPLVLRHQLNHNALINNNSISNSGSGSNTINKTKHKEVSSIERRLHFIAAFYHLINGCPLLSLDILRRLPKYVSTEAGAEKEANIEASSASVGAMLNNDVLFTSSFVDNKAAKVEQKATLIDWSASNFDLLSNRCFKDEQLELDLELDLKLSDSDEHEHSEINANELDGHKSEQKVHKSTNDTHTCQQQQQQQQQDSDKIVDTFSQQLKFISCLKILIEEMSNLANGFEVIGGQLRYYMYYWLDRETKLLRELGDYKDHETTSLISFEEDLAESWHTLDEEKNCNKASSSLLHEEVLNDQLLFQQKIKRLNNRKIWLRSNELLLRTLLSYCSLHSASAQGLISVKMELLLLMQELIEDRSSTVKQLYEPMPIHTTTTIPLLSATIASSKNMLAGPIQMLRRLSTDLLSTISSINIFPTIFDFPLVITTIKEICVSLSSCIYQCLCDSDNVLYRINEDARQTDNSSSLNNIGIEELSRNILYRSVSIIKDHHHSNEIKSNGQKKICSTKVAIQSQPKNWPGISNLNKLLDSNNDDLEFPKLKILLFESLVAVFASLLLNALVFYDCSNLYRILSKEWKDKMWNKLFGGAATIEFKYKFSSNSVCLDDENQKQRIRMNTRLGHRLNSKVPSSNQSFTNQTNMSQTNVASDERVYLREKFIPPEISMINYFLNKDDSESELSDSNSSSFEESDTESDTFKKDAYEDDSNLTNEKNKLEHMNPKSYSWFLMRFAILKYSLHCITSFLSILGIEPNEIATLSPLIHQVMKTFEKWMKLLLIEMNSIHKDGPPQDFIKLDPNILESDAGNNFNGPKILKYQLILDPNNTPFINDKSSFGARRLWNFLVTKKCLHEFFIRQIFKRNQVSNNLSNNTRLNETNDNLLKKSEIQNEFAHLNNSTKTLKIIHKDQETINSFCINERSKNTLALCTNKEIIEIDVGDLLIKNTSKTIEDDYQVDINAFNSQQGLGIQENDHDVNVMAEFGLNFQNQNYASLAEQKLALNPGNAKNLRSNTLGNMILKRNTKDVRKLASHPTLPYYLSGTGDSIVKLWHWGSQDALSTIKQQEKINSSSKITQILFNSHGNKFGVSDIDGYLHLYQLLGCSFKPYLTMRCQKVINDFIFVESSSILLTVGTVNDSFVISLWDTLMPSNKSLVKSFKEQDVPSGTCASYSLLNHLAYCGTRKGDVYVYDIRTHKKLSKFMAHESSVKTMALNSDEYLLATGSSEGSVKVWNLRTCDIKYSFPNEHSKSSLIRSFNSGVNQLRFTDDSQLLSCGADGTLGIRNLN